MACVVWTVLELVRLSQSTPSLVGASTRRADPRSASSRAHRRAPLAAWDDQGRPIFVEDVSLRAPR
jgi:hypothetical protein